MTAAKPMARRLSRDEFADALRKGLGRALLHVHRYELDGVADLVLEACLQSQVYDTECESSRADWLFRMFRDSRHYPTFSEALRAVFEEDREIQPADADLVCELLKLMAVNGDTAAREALIGFIRDQAAIPGSDDTIGEVDWLELDGCDALLELARIYGRRLQRDPQDRVPESLIYAKIPGHAVKEALQEFAQADRDAKVYWDYLEAHGAFEPGPGFARGSPRAMAILYQLETQSDIDGLQTQQRRWVRQHYTVERILQSSRGKGPENLGHFVTFGRHATPEELEQIYAHLMEETDEDVQARLLRVFRRRPLPGLDDRLFRWATGGPAALRHAAIAALAHSPDDRVHELARWKARAGELTGPDQEALSLFVNNYSREDASLIARALRSLAPDADDAHALASDLVDLADKQRDATLAGALTWGYENTPCAICRYSVIKQLSLVQRFGEALRYECIFDADKQIGEFAKSLPITGLQPTEVRGLGQQRHWKN